MKKLLQAPNLALATLWADQLASAIDAQDLAQEAFLRIFRSLDRFDFEHAFTTWLYRIVTNIFCLGCWVYMVHHRLPAVTEFFIIRFFSNPSLQSSYFFIWSFSIRYWTISPT